ncbi:MAG: hypothetical protein A2X23_00315 [Chloroflexi bacterium GWC2_73_18]|nr:MAG: hypothetical protein A2X23_00315 [Chloroflexi bacterium GWC2_73_18]
MTVDPRLDTLEARGLIRLATIQPELEYLFRHWLVQDAAYNSLLKQERRGLHRLVGEALEGLYPERRPELSAVLALHFEEAGDEARAIDHLVEAGRYALERHAITEARGFFDRALALMPAGDEPEYRAKRVEASIGSVKAGWTFNPLEGELATLEAVIPTAEALGDLRLLAEAHVYDAMLRQFGGETHTASPELRRSLQRIGEIGRELGDESIRALPLAIVGTFQIFTGYLREGIAALTEAAPVLEARNDSIGASFARDGLAIGYARLGDFERAEAAAAQAVELAKDADAIAQLDALIGQAAVRSAQGRLDEAIPLAQLCIGKAEESGATACIVVSGFILGDALMRQGLVEEAKRVLERSGEISLVSGRAFWRPTIEAWLGYAGSLLGEFPATEQGWDATLAAAREVGDRFAEAGILWKRGQALAAAAEERDAALADLAASAALFEEMGARPFLARVLRSWGEALRAAGRRDEASDRLRRALELFEAMGIGGEAEAVRAALANAEGATGVPAPS